MCGMSQEGSSFGSLLVRGATTLQTMACATWRSTFPQFRCSRAHGFLHQSVLAAGARTLFLGHGVPPRAIHPGAVFPSFGTLLVKGVLQPLSTSYLGPPSVICKDTGFEVFSPYSVIYTPEPQILYSARPFASPSEKNSPYWLLTNSRPVLLEPCIRRLTAAIAFRRVQGSLEAKDAIPPPMQAYRRRVSPQMGARFSRRLLQWGSFFADVFVADWDESNAFCTIPAATHCLRICTPGSARGREDSTTAWTCGSSVGTPSYILTLLRLGKCRWPLIRPLPVHCYMPLYCTAALACQRFDSKLPPLRPKSLRGGVRKDCHHPRVRLGFAVKEDFARPPRRRRLLVPVFVVDSVEHVDPFPQSPMPWRVSELGRSSCW